MEIDGGSNDRRSLSLSSLSSGPGIHRASQYVDNEAAMEWRTRLVGRRRVDDAEDDLVDAKDVNLLLFGNPSSSADDGDEDAPPPPSAPPILRAALSHTPVVLIPADRVGDGAWRQFKGIILSLIEMGYSYERAQEAAFRTKCDGLSAAVAWLVDHEDEGAFAITSTQSVGNERNPPLRSISQDDSSSSSSRGGDSGDLPPPIIAPSLARFQTDPTNATDLAKRQRIEEFRALKKLRAQQFASIPAEGSGVEEQKEGGGKTNEELARDDVGVCGVCWDAINPDGPVESRPISTPCGHQLCHTCMANFFKGKINDGNTEGIACPLKHMEECEHELAHEEVRALVATLRGAGAVDQTIEDKLVRFQHNKQVETDPDAFWCVNPGCNTVVHASGPMRWLLCCTYGREAVCTECSTSLCTQCAGLFHGAFRSCGAVSDAALAQYSKEKNVQNCPRCRRRTEKNDGCHHMTCFCGYEYCWVCRGPYPCAQAHFGANSQGEGGVMTIGGDCGQRLIILGRMALIFAVFVGFWVAVPLAGFAILVFTTMLLYTYARAAYVMCMPLDDVRRGLSERLSARIDKLKGELALIGELVLLIGVAGPFALACVVGGAAIIAAVTLPVAVALVLVDGALFVSGRGTTWVKSPHMDVNLPHWLIKVGRHGCAALWFSATFLPTLAITLVLWPVGSCFLCPIFLVPAIMSLSVAAAVILTVLSTAAAFLVTYFALGLSTTWVICLTVASFFVFGNLYYSPPTSDYAFAGFLWIFCLSPTVWLLDYERGKLGFGPTPLGFSFWDD